MLMLMMMMEKNENEYDTGEKKNYSNNRPTDWLRNGKEESEWEREKQRAYTRNNRGMLQDKICNVRCEYKITVVHVNWKQQNNNNEKIWNKCDAN